MTAGIMMGNGFQSDTSTGGPLGFRGIAPEALFSCPENADVSNWSFADSNGSYNSTMVTQDSKVVGTLGLGHHHPQVGAVGNNGLHQIHYNQVGYYSVYRPAKNEIVVANMSTVDWRWNGSSIGPTWDGRIKPDLAAFGGAHTWQGDMPEMRMDIDYIQITGGGARTWNFDSTGAEWAGGFLQHPSFGAAYLSDQSQDHFGGTTTMSFTLDPPPYNGQYGVRPRFGTLTEPDGASPLRIAGAADDVVTIRYRLPYAPLWNGTNITLYYSVLEDPDSTYYGTYHDVTLHADGQWHVATVPVGQRSLHDGSNTWAGKTVNMIHFIVPGPTNARPGERTHGYLGTSGSSAAAPVVAGAIATLAHQLTDQFGVDLTARTPSPFYEPGRGVGVPFPSTYKALLIQTAKDLASVPHRTPDENPDTSEPTVYHRGPDLVTGYGMVDIGAASRHLADESNSQAVGGPPRIIESTLSNRGHVRTITVGQGTPELKVTMAWDDPPGSTATAEVEAKLVNNLDLLLEGPDGNWHHPWTIQQPYEPSGPAEYPASIEPEPIATRDIVPARRDRANNLDNVEQVVVDHPVAGEWRVHIYSGGMAFHLKITP